MYKVLGDIIKDSKDYDVIVHGCNCFHKMGAGVAKSIKERFPEAYEADLNTEYGDKSKLGTLSSVTYEKLTVVNAYTQFDYKKSKRTIHADYEAIRKCMSLIKKHYSGKKIAMPTIGAGLARGSWVKIRNIIDTELKGEDVTIIINDETRFYNILVNDVLDFYKKHIPSYNRGAHSIMGLFTAKAMKDSKNTANESKLLRITRNKINERV